MVIDEGHSGGARAFEPQTRSGLHWTAVCTWMDLLPDRVGCTDANSHLDTAQWAHPFEHYAPAAILLVGNLVNWSEERNSERALALRVLLRRRPIGLRGRISAQHLHMVHVDHVPILVDQ